ncbi:MAG: MFS transporter [Chloroflexota bacterium]
MPRDLYFVAASLLTWGIGGGMIFIFQPLYIQELGADPILIGTILGASGIAMTISHIPAGYLADRIGRRPMMWASWILGFIAAVVMALARGLPVFVVGILLYGLTSSVLSPLNSYVVAARGKWSVGRAVSLISASCNTGAIFGPLLGGLVAERFGLRWIYNLAAIFFFLSLILILFIRPQPIENNPEQKNGKGLLRNKHFIILLGMIFVVMFAVYLPQPLASNYLKNQRQLSLETIGQLGAIGNLGNVVIMLLVGQLPGQLAFTIGQMFVGVFTLLLWQGSGVTWYAIGYFFIGGYRLCHSMTVAMVRPLVQEAEVGLAFGFTETANSLSLIAAPLLAALIYDREPVAIFPVSLAVICLATVLSLLVLRVQAQRKLKREISINND